MATSARCRSTAVIFSAISWACGCVLDTGDKTACGARADCVDDYRCFRGICVEDSEWGCMAVDPGIEAGDDPVAVRLLLLDEATEAPVPAAMVRRCLRSDLDCAGPTLEGTTDAAGSLELTIDDEYLEITAAGYRNTIVMSVHSLEVTTADVEPRVVHFDLFSSTGFNALAGGTGVEPNEQRADIEVLARDCAYESVGGVEVALDAADSDTIARYLVNDLPSRAAVETDVSSGSILFFNAAPGLRAAGAIIRSTERPVGPQHPVIARAGWLSHLAIAPPGVRIHDARGD